MRGTPISLKIGAMQNRHLLVVVLVVLATLAVLRMAGTYSVPVLDQVDRFTLGSQQAA